MDPKPARRSLRRESAGIEAAPAAAAAVESGHDPLWSIFLRFLKFGALAWGGPAAQIAMIKHECVDEEGWVSEATFQKTLAVLQVLPGPEAHKLCVSSGGSAAAG
jgi:chromate transporter